MPQGMAGPFNENAGAPAFVCSFFITKRVTKQTLWLTALSDSSLLFQCSSILRLFY
jgi:hypothetical protein